MSTYTSSHSFLSTNTVSFTITCDLAIYLFLLFFSPSIIAAQNCSAATCSSSAIRIRFPFHLEGSRSQHCGYPGFSLSCSSSLPRKPVVKLPNSGEFYVRNINYIKQQINLYDPENCLPERLLRLDLSESPYLGAYRLNFTFLSCPRNPGFRSFGVIDCLSNGTNTVLAISDSFWAFNMISYFSCATIATIPVPVPRPMKEEDGYSVDFNNNNLQLSWDRPNCRSCEKNGGTCRFKNHTRQEISCFDQKAGNGGREIARIVSLSITLPVLICGIGIACHRCCRNRVSRGGDESRSSEQTILQPTVVAVGLSEKTIQTFAKLELGESRRIVGPNDVVCPICLSEYLPKEVLRCIPECNHCFHADCIDPWLRMNQKCPICRNCPCPNA
ncbi:hypothetical protein CRG98_039128 [Punica granatum]|uniref:RING-type domain-containing protein n=1 Tax=Punica granatum TaxID=22663 RepID=A0A2I0I934_PUNGR|nr:hypothetical protein CRG98_039128 [Punica granatum]